MNPDCPCRSCIAPKRKPGCHATCPEFAEFSETRGKKKQAEKEARKNDAYFSLKLGGDEKLYKYIIRRRNR